MTIFVRFLVLALVLVLGHSVDSRGGMVDCARVRQVDYHDGVGMLINNVGLQTSEDEDILGFSTVDFFNVNSTFCTVLWVAILNDTGGPLHVNPHHFRAVTTENETVPHSSWTYRTRDPFPAVTLEPGTSASGMIVFGPKSGLLDRIIYDNGKRRVGRDAFHADMFAVCAEK